MHLLHNLFLVLGICTALLPLILTCRLVLQRLTAISPAPVSFSRNLGLKKVCRRSLRGSELRAGSTATFCTSSCLFSAIYPTLKPGKGAGVGRRIGTDVRVGVGVVKEGDTENEDGEEVEDMDEASFHTFCPIQLDTIITLSGTRVRRWITAQASGSLLTFLH